MATALSAQFASCLEPGVGSLAHLSGSNSATEASICIITARPASLNRAFEIDFGTKITTRPYSMRTKRSAVHEYCRKEVSRGEDDGTSDRRVGRSRPDCRTQVARQGDTPVILDVYALRDSKRGAVFIQGSILDWPKLTEIFRGYDCIVHIAAWHRGRAVTGIRRRSPLFPSMVSRNSRASHRDRRSSSILGPAAWRRGSNCRDCRKRRPREA
jgi:hypothetical protein